MRRVVDSSGWLEYLQGTERADLFQPALEGTEAVLVPGITVYEVHRLIASKQGDHAADVAVGRMRRQTFIPLDAEIGVAASRLSRQHRLAAADAIIYASAQIHEAELWTQDAHFQGLPDVNYFPKP